MACQKTVIIGKNPGVHLTADGPILYTRFRQSNVSLNGSGAVFRAVSSRMLLAGNIWFVQVEMAVRPIMAFLSRGTPFANQSASMRETDFETNAVFCLTMLLVVSLNRRATPHDRVGGEHTWNFGASGFLTAQTSGRIFLFWKPGLISAL